MINVTFGRQLLVHSFTFKRAVYRLATTTGFTHHLVGPLDYDKTVLITTTFLFPAFTRLSSQRDGQREQRCFDLTFHSPVPSAVRVLEHTFNVR